MAVDGLKERVAILESQVSELRSQIAEARKGEPKGWEKMIGAFTDDEGMKDILKDAMRLREVDRKKARAKRTAKRKSQR